MTLVKWVICSAPFLLESQVFIQECWEVLPSCLPSTQGMAWRLSGVWEKLEILFPVPAGTGTTSWGPCEKARARGCHLSTPLPRWACSGDPRPHRRAGGWAVGSGARLMCSDGRNFPSDNGPCQQVCRVVGGTAMCSCFPGYAIMADGLSCEGEYFGVTL